MTLEEAADLAAKAGEAYGEYVYRVKENEFLLKALFSAKFVELDDGPTSRLEHLAKASKSYQMLSSQAASDLREAGKRKVAYENAIRQWETIRTNDVRDRQEKKIFGG